MKKFGTPKGDAPGRANGAAELVVVELVPELLDEDFFFDVDFLEEEVFDFLLPVVLLPLLLWPGFLPLLLGLVEWPLLLPEEPPWEEGCLPEPPP